MKTCKIELKNQYSFVEGGTLECIVMEKPYDADKVWKRPAVIVVPGGGYGLVSKREGQPVANAFLARGFQAFILDYLCGGENGYSYPEQLFELSAAVDYIKKNAEELYVNADEIFVVGFSAGGHLVGNLAVEHQNVSKKTGVELDCKPTAVGLAYPVIYEEGHLGSYKNLLYGYTDEAKAELLKTLNLHEAVNEQTPPAFVWTTAGDKVVRPDCSLKYVLALEERKIPYELHVYPQGGHGLSTADLEVNQEGAHLRRISKWLEDCADFFRLFVTEKFKM